MSSGRTPIGEILLRHEHLRSRELERLISEPDRKHRLVSMLILRAEIEIDDATLALSEQSGYPGALERHLEQRDVALAKTFPPALMKTLGVVPLVRTAAGALVVIARDPSPALADVLLAELATPIELAIVPAIFIDRLVQRLAGAPPGAGPPSLPEIDRPGPTRHRKTISVVMRAPLEPDAGPARMSSSPPAETLNETSLGMPAVGRPPAVIRIPAREDSGAKSQPREGSVPNAIPLSPRTISSNTIKRQTGGSAPFARPSEGSGPTRPRDGSGPNPQPQGEGSGADGIPKPPRTISSNTIRRQTGGSAPLTRPDGSGATREGSAPNPRSSDAGFETRTPPLGSRGTPRAMVGEPRAPEPEPGGLILDLGDNEPPITTTRPTQPLFETPRTKTRPAIPEPPKRITQPLPQPRRAGTTHPIPNATLRPLLDESEPTPPPHDIAMIESGRPTDDVPVGTRPTRPSIIVPAEAMEAALEAVEFSQRPTKLNVMGRATPNIIKRPPTPLPIAPQPSLVPIDPDSEPPIDPARAQIRPTYPKFELHDKTPVVPRPSTDDNWGDFEDAIVTGPAQDPIPPEPKLEVESPASSVSLRTTMLGTPPPVPPPGTTILRDIERALSRATADRLLMKHAATRWNALLLVNVADGRARGARGHGPRLQAGVESIELTVASSSLLQAACDPDAPRPAGKDPLFDLLGNPANPSSAPIVVDDRVIAVLAAGDPLDDGTAEDLRALASALAVAYQRFPAR